MIRVLHTQEVDGHVYRKIERPSRTWRRGPSIVHERDGKIISRETYDHEVRGIAPPAEIERGTCQICLRKIGVATGQIALHGYTRPHQGWQTRSCFGAKWRALEVACDALPPAIDGLENYVQNRREHREELRASPPATITLPRRRDGTPGAILTRPEGFDPTEEGYDSYRPNTYANAFWSDVRQTARNIKSAEGDIALLRQRLADWKPAKETV